jgi:glycosyltransferase involved in cell wall biosynthesis
MRLSIVIVGRNEEKRLAACIQSVIKGSEKIPDREIVYVDSASTDRSVEIARRFPIRVLRIPDDRPLSAAAGRFIGTLETHGRFIFFIDGDTVLYQRWLLETIQKMESYPRIAGIAGMVHILIGDGRDKPKLVRNRYQFNSDIQVKTLGGIALYRRSALELAGSFNPFIKVDEEPELALRLRRLGFEIVRSGEVMAVTHYEYPRESIREYFRRRKSHLYDYGITLRYAQTNGLFWRYAFERLNHVITFLFGLTILCLTTYLAFAKGRIGLLAITLLAMLVIFLIWRQGDIRGIALSLLKRALMTERTLATYLGTRALPLTSYPTKVNTFRNEFVNA